MLTGFVAEYSAQPFNRDGWGGFPLDVTATIEKDKTNTCLQAEASTSIVHSTAAFGSRHITQVCYVVCCFLNVHSADYLVHVEASTSIVHSTAACGSRHIAQVQVDG